MGHNRRFKNTPPEVVEELKEKLEGIEERLKSLEGKCLVCKSSYTYHHMIPEAFAKAHEVNNDIMSGILPLCSFHHATLERYIDALFRATNENNKMVSVLDILIISTKFALLEGVIDIVRKHLKPTKKKEKKKFKRHKTMKNMASENEEIEWLSLALMNEMLIVKSLVEEKTEG